MGTPEDSSHKPVWFAVAVVCWLAVEGLAEWAWRSVIDSVPFSRFNAMYLIGTNAFWRPPILGLVLWTIAATVMALLFASAVRFLGATGTAWVAVAVGSVLFAAVAAAFYLPTFGAFGPRVFFDLLWGPILHLGLLTLGAWLGTRVGARA